MNVMLMPQAMQNKKKRNKLYSDGLEEDEYIYWDNNKGFCYEDGCVIGGTFDQTLNRLHSLKWCFHHKFYVKNNK